jgi:predicted permease
VLIPVPFPAWLLVTLHRLSDTLAPLALISIGLQLRRAAPAGNFSAVAIALGYKLVLERL